jgi:hypothetical protein
MGFGFLMRRLNHQVRLASVLKTSRESLSIDEKGGTNSHIYIDSDTDAMHALVVSTQSEKLN